MMAIKVLDAVLPLAVASLVEFLNDPGARPFRPAVVAINVLDEHRQTLSSVAQLGGSCVTGTRPLEHDPCVAEMHLRAADRSTRFAIAIVLSEPKSPGEPSHSRGDIPINDMGK